MDIDLFKVDIQKCLDHLNDELSQIRTGRATPELVQEIPVNAYETMAPIRNYATISIMDAKTIVIQPWDKSIVDNISKAVTNANMGFLPSRDGDRILVKIPDLTEERRKEYVKVMKERVEDARIAVRQIRQKFMKDIDESLGSGFSEDDADRLRTEVEKIVKESNTKIEELKEKKEKELMSF